ncbi:SA1362 family protein [Salirhabdus salicampi]|uniref:SA1362 family protein n=1 Tax=Salirhabdus salicampi TaxID=476102 RepID=UPI0020C4E541|nr:SA1362 family protein [Salirhabdus salicampi]MCP8616833.1 hypothetical protein [Salirhabdus salicampi]
MFPRLNPFFYILFGLALIGLFSQLFFNTASFFKYILMSAGFIAIIFAVFYFVMRSRNSATYDHRYKKAVKQSQRKYGKSGRNASSFNLPKKLQNSKKAKANRQATHLKVIDGKKDKKRNRASF